MVNIGRLLPDIIDLILYLEGKVAFITGATSGIGETTEEE